MNKKTTTIFLIIMFIVGGLIFITAQSILSHNIIIELSKDSKDKLIEN